MLRLGGLFGTSALCWLAYIAFGPSSKTTLIGPLFYWFWFVPLPYIASWLVLTCRSLAGAVVSFAFLAGANLFITGLGVTLGTGMLGLLSVQAMLAGYFVLGWLLGVVDAFPDFEGARDRLLAHASGFVLASFAVYASPFLMLGGGDPPSSEAAYRTVGVLALGFAFHAMATRRQIADSANRPGAAARIAVLFALALAAPTWIVAPQHFGDKGLWWPFEVRGASNAARSSRCADPFQFLRLDPAAEPAWPCPRGAR